MTSFGPFVFKIKPAMDTFLRAPSKANLANVEEELYKFNWTEMKIFHVQILLPLVLKLEELNGQDQELRTGTMNCIRYVTSKLYLKDVKGLRTMLVIFLKQIRECESATTKANLSEEIKLAAVQGMAEALRRSTTDVLEEFYTNDSAMLLGQILLTLVEFIEKEKYRKLVIICMQCLMVIFYVHEEADFLDVVLRNQVSNTLFIFLPKILTILFKTSLSDDKQGETLKSTAIKALGRILCVIYEETTGDIIKKSYDLSEFQMLIDEALKSDAESFEDIDMLKGKRTNEQLEERLKRMQGAGRTQQWFWATSRKLSIIFQQTSILRSHQSHIIRQEYATMCAMLMQNCPHNLKHNFIVQLENIVAMSEDEDPRIRRICGKALQQLQDDSHSERIFDENCELLLDEHLAKLPRIINRCDEAEQFAELMFLKGFLRNLSATKLHLLLSIPKNLEMFTMCLLSAVDLKVTRDLLTEEYALRQMKDEDFIESAKLNWREFKNLSSLRCVQIVKDICAILGETKMLNRLFFDYFTEILSQQNEAMNEIILIMIWMATSHGNDRRGSTDLVEILLEEVLNDKHWHLALQPDQVWRLKVDKPTNWFVDRTPGLYESAIEIRVQDCDSDDENDSANVTSHSRVTIADAQFNVLHTCITLDALGHCAMYLGSSFDKYLFRSVHKVLLKLASSNSVIYSAANFALISMQRGLKLAKISHFVESCTDYITYHLNTILKRTPESRSAVDILTVVLQFSTRNALPHLDSIFQTIREECTKASQTENIISYLKVFNAFLSHVSRWHLSCDKEMNHLQHETMQVDSDLGQELDLFSNWVNVLQTPAVDNIELDTAKENMEYTENNSNNPKKMENTAESADQDTEAPHNIHFKSTRSRYIEVINDILNQVLKFVSSNENMYQILALDCLITGIPLLKDYEDELLPLVHLIWQPLVEKFRQRDAIVLNRCFTLLNLLASYAKEFILKRSLDDVIPFLKQFMKEAAKHSAVETIKTKTQEYKLQLKLLQEFPNLIQSMQIDGKQLNEVVEVTVLYLSEEQPKELQECAVQSFNLLRFYNGPLIYLVVSKKSYLRDYKENVSKLLTEFQV